DVVGAEALERFVHRGLDPACSRTACRLVAVHDTSELRGHHGSVAAASERAAEVGLGDTVGSVLVGDVEEVDPDVERTIDDRLDGVRIGGRPELVAADADHGDVEVADLLHAHGSLLGSGLQSGGWSLLYARVNATRSTLLAPVSGISSTRW